MEARAVVRHVRMSPRKMRVVANLVRGKRVDEADGDAQAHAEEGARRSSRKLLIEARRERRAQAGGDDVDDARDPRHAPSTTARS